MAQQPLATRGNFLHIYDFHVTKGKENEFIRLFEEHARIRKVLANEIKPEFIKYIEGGTFVPKYVEVVLSTPDEILNKAAAE
jgi:hypothetical protein